MVSGFLQETFSLEGRVALCTGASSGIGRRMAGALARAGAAVVLVARRLDRLREAQAEIAEAGGKADCLKADLSTPAAADDVVARAAPLFGAPDILVNAAGINPRQAPEEITLESWDRTLAINLSLPFFMARACVPGMKAKGGGNIINIASLQSFRAFPKGAPYGASKGGLTQLTRAMAEAWSRDGIVANAIAPGFFETELTQAVYADPALGAQNAAKTAIGRNGALSDLDGPTVFLASRAAAYVTGQVLAVDGGFTAK